MILRAELTEELMRLRGTGKCARHVGEAALVHFAYKIEDVIKEVKKITNYVGASRTTAEGATLVDKYTYTNDEYDLDRTLTRDAMAQVFVPLLEFTRGVADAYHYDEGIRTIRVKEQLGLTLSAAYTYDTADRTLTWEVRTSGELPEGAWISIRSVVAYEVADIYGRRIKRFARQEVKLQAQHKSETREDGTVVYKRQTKPRIDVDEEDCGLGAEELLNVTVEDWKVRLYEKNAQKLRAGDWVEVELLGGIGKATYLVLRDCDTNTELGHLAWFRHMEYDFRHTIHYVLWFEHLRSTAVLQVIDTDIFMALAEYCVYRWFLMVAPTEAEVYFNLFMNRLEKIKAQLDTLRGALTRRNYIWF